MRYVVAGLCGLIVLLVVLLLVMRSRRERARIAAAEPGSPRPRPRSRAPQGQHQQRRPDLGPGPGPAAAGPSRPQPGPPGPADWTASGGWHGGGLGEMQPAPAAPVPASPASVPAVAPPRHWPRNARPASAAAGSSGPPWAPAPEPEEHAFGLLPVAANTVLPPGSGIRVPGDVAAPAARQDFDFAAAPVPVDYAPRRAPDFTVPSRAGGVVLSADHGRTDDGPAGNGPQAAAPEGSRAAFGSGPGQADPGYIWDLAATDVFPAAAKPGSAPQPPGAAGADDDPGASAAGA